MCDAPTTVWILRSRERRPTNSITYHSHPIHPLLSPAGVGIRDLAGDAFDFLRKSSSLIQEHYPERSAVIVICNAPSWFSFLWKRACVDTTTNMTRVCGGRGSGHPVTLEVTRFSHPHTFCTPRPKSDQAHGERADAEEGQDRGGWPRDVRVPQGVCRPRQSSPALRGGAQVRLGVGGGAGSRSIITPTATNNTNNDQHSYGDEIDCRWSSPEEVALRAHVEAANAKAGVEFKMA